MTTFQFYVPSHSAGKNNYLISALDITGHHPTDIMQVENSRTPIALVRHMNAQPGREMAQKHRDLSL